MKLETIAVILLALCIALVIGYAVRVDNSHPVGSGGQPISATPRLGLNSSSTVTSTASLVLAASSNTQLRKCSNIGLADVWISSTSTTLGAVTGGYWFKASSSETFSGDGLWQGDIWGITRAGTTTTIHCWQI